MRKAVLLALVAAATMPGGVACRRPTTTPAEESPPAPTVAKAPAPAAAKKVAVERRPATLEGTSRGPADAIINVVEFADFQCQYCAQVQPTIAQVSKAYPGKIRFFFRHFPLLGVNEDAVPASEAALAAEDQGKFWEMHDKLFANQKALKRADLVHYARELKLDLGKFEAALDDHKHLARVQADMAAGQALGVPFTPVFFINGRPLGGAQAFDEWKRIIDDELGLAEGLLASGVGRAQLHERLMQGAAMPAAKPGPRQSATTEIYKVAVGGAPTRGGKQPKVTIVEFCEFECPYCKAAQPTLEKVLATYGDDVQLAWKHLPLPMHRHSALAAMASQAAHAQGKFWQMHDLLFANQAALDRASLERYAQQLGLDLAAFKRGLDEAKPGNVIDADAQQAQRFGRTGTPSFFVNGRALTGAQPFETWKALIDEELGKADSRLASGVPRSGLYADFIAKGLLGEKAPPAAHEMMPAGPNAAAAVRVDVGDAPVRGAANALVTLVVFSDFECPFCAKIEPTLDKVLKAYPGKVRLVWKDFPLDIHPRALPAALAARAAGEQGKFWEMHDRLFTAGGFDRPSLEKHAETLGLDLARFRAALDSEKGKPGVLADTRQGRTAGVAATPTVFVNGVMLSGALPFESFKSTIDEQLAKARKLVAGGTPRGRVYETLMNKAHAGVVEAARNRPAANM